MKITKKYDYNKLAIQLHKKYHGKISINPKVKLDTKKDLSIAYTPGVGEISRCIYKDKNLSYIYTNRANTVAVITDGSAVLGLGNIGPLAGMPVMEGKCILFKKFANIDAIPIVLNTQEIDDIINTIKNISLSFGGINLEDISAPRCFEIEKRLINELDIPVFHDDQHGTAIVILAGLINALKLVNKKITNVKIVINGAGAASIATTKLLYYYIYDYLKNDNVNTDIILCDTKGTIYDGRSDLNTFKQEISKITNKYKIKGNLTDAIKDADVFIGLSVGNIVSKDMIKSMNKDAIIFAMANPIPEIMPDIAISAGAKVVATGRSDFANQINNVLVFPGIFRAMLDIRYKMIKENIDKNLNKQIPYIFTDEIKVNTAIAISGCVKKINHQNIIPSVFDKNIVRSISKAVNSYVYKIQN